MTLTLCKPPEFKTLSSHTDERGTLHFGEIENDWDFDIKRIYFSSGFSKDTIRGGHAHKNLQQVLICMSGSFEVLTDNGAGDRKTWLFERPGQALRLHSPVWRELKSLSNDAVFLSLASAPYDADDYIREYDAFLSYVESGK